MKAASRALPERAPCIAALRRLVLEREGIEAAVLAFRDGRAFAACARQARAQQPDRFAAMVSSMAALGRTVLKELHAGHLDHVLVEGSQGKLVVSAIAAGNGLLVLAVLAHEHALLGAVLSHTKSCVSQIAAEFPAEGATAAVTRR